MTMMIRPKTSDDAYGAEGTSVDLVGNDGAAAGEDQGEGRESLGKRPAKERVASYPFNGLPSERARRGAP